MHARLLPLATAMTLLLPACDNLGATTMVTRSTIDGTDTVHVVTEVAHDVARFHCKAARSGLCRIVVFTRTCEQDVSLREARIDQKCTTRALARIDVDAGTTREVRGLPAAMRQCADDRVAPDLAACTP